MKTRQICLVYHGNHHPATYPWLVSLTKQLWEVDEGHRSDERRQKNIYIYCEGDFQVTGIFASIKRSVILSDLAQIQNYIFGMAVIVLLAFDNYILGGIV